MGQRGRFKIVVSGRVQGVYFRASTRDRALAAGLVGYVRNLDDGRVEVVVEGTCEAAGALIAWCGSGPAAARVVRVEVLEQAFSGDLEGFEIRR